MLLQQLRLSVRTGDRSTRHVRYPVFDRVDMRARWADHVAVLHVDLRRQRERVPKAHLEQNVMQRLQSRQLLLAEVARSRDRWRLLRQALIAELRRERQMRAANAPDVPRRATLPSRS